MRILSICAKQNSSTRVFNINWWLPFEIPFIPAASAPFASCLSTGGTFCRFWQYCLESLKIISSRQSENGGNVSALPMCRIRMNPVIQKNYLLAFSVICDWEPLTSSAICIFRISFFSLWVRFRGQVEMVTSSRGWRVTWRDQLSRLSVTPR